MHLPVYLSRARVIDQEDHTGAFKWQNRMVISLGSPLELPGSDEEKKIKDARILLTSISDFTELVFDLDILGIKVSQQ